MRGGVEWVQYVPPGIVNFGDGEEKKKVDILRLDDGEWRSSLAAP
jgi:hypothetical protein